MKSRFATILLAVLVVTTACKASSPAPLGATDEGMDRSVHPGDDFYAYVNGGWLKTTESPADKSIVFGVMLDDETRKRVAALIQKSANTGAGLSDEAKKVGDFFSSYVDEGTIEAKGIAPLKPELDEIAGIRDKHDLARAIGGTLRADVDPL